MPNTYNTQSFECYRGEDFRLVLTGASAAPDPSAFALLSTVSRYPGGTPIDSSTSVTTGGSSGAWTLTVDWTRVQTSLWTERSLVVDVWRTDTASNVRLAGGTVTVNTPVRLPA